jgi:excisionase family DNA binding protein
VTKTIRDYSDDSLAELEQSPEQYFTVNEVAEIYRVTPRTIRNWTDRGLLKAWRKDRLIRIPRSALDKFDKSK